MLMLTTHDLILTAVAMLLLGTAAGVAVYALVETVASSAARIGKVWRVMTYSNREAVHDRRI